MYPTASSSECELDQCVESSHTPLNCFAVLSRFCHKVFLHYKAHGHMKMLFHA